MKLDSEDQRTGLIEIMGRANFSGRELKHGFFLLKAIEGAEILPVMVPTAEEDIAQSDGPSKTAAE